MEALWKCIVVLEKTRHILVERRTVSVIATGHELSVEVSSKEADRNRRNFFVHIALSHSMRWRDCLKLLNAGDNLLACYYINIRQEFVKFGIVKIWRTTNAASRLHVHISVHNNTTVVMWYDYRSTLTLAGPICDNLQLSAAAHSQRQYASAACGAVE